MADQAQKTIHIKYVRSGIGFDFHTKTMIRSLGLNRLNQVVERQNTPQIRGLVARIPHFVEIVKPEAAPAWTLTPEHTIFPPEPKPERVKPSKPAASRDAEVKHDDASASPKAERHEKKEEKATGAKHKKAAKHDAPAKHAAHAGKEKGKAAKTEAPKKKAKAADAKHATHDKKGKK